MNRSATFGIGLIASFTLALPAQAGFYGPTLLSADSYNYATDSVSNILVTYTGFAFSSSGVVDGVRLGAHPNFISFGGVVTFNVLQLRPTGGSSYQVVAQQAFLTSNFDHVATDFALATPWSVQAGDLYAHYGQGVPILIPASSNPPAPWYFGSHLPNTGETITLGSGDYGAGNQSRDYGLQVHLSDSVAVASPEPTSLALLGIGAVGMLGYRLRRRKPADAP